MNILKEDFVNEELAWWGVPGVEVGMVRSDPEGHGETLLARGYGLRSLEARLPMTKDSLGDIASCSKAFAAAAAAALADEGVIDFDTPIRHWLPDFRLYDDFATKECCLRDIFCHRTGIAGHDAMWPMPGCSREAFYHQAACLRPNRPFRSTPQYSNTMYDLAGCILEKISGEKYEDLVRTRILEPLGMNRTTLSLHEMQADPDWAAGYFAEDVGPGAVDLSVDSSLQSSRSSSSCGQDPQQGQLRRMPGWEMSDIGNPAAGVNSCVTDMLKWITLHLAGGMYEGKRILSERVVRDMHTPIVNMSAFPWRFPEVPGFGLYGMGWKTAVYRDMVMVYHCGEIEGYSSITTFLPDQGLGMFVLCNRHTMVTPFLLELVYTAFDQALGFPEVDWAARLHAYAHTFTGSCADWRMDFGTPSSDLPMNYPGFDFATCAGSYANPAYGTLTISYGRPEGSIGVSYMTKGRQPSPVNLYLHYKDWILPLELPDTTPAGTQSGGTGKDSGLPSCFILHNLKEDTLLCTTWLQFDADAQGCVRGFFLKLDGNVPAEYFSRN